MYTVYCHTNKLNGKRYVGITSMRPEVRWGNGNNYRSSRHFNFAIEKYGWDGFTHEVIAEGLTKEEACQMEQDLIKKYKTTNDRYGYNQRSEVTSSRRTKNGQPVQGFSEDFAYDPIGNRKTSSTYNEKGEAQTSTYQANNLNQYTSRTTPGYAAVRGEADPDATVTVNENPTFRLGEYYFGSDTFDNSTAGGLANLETYAVLASPTNGPDEISAAPPDRAQQIIQQAESHSQRAGKQQGHSL